ncbi:MAG: hypothetical protein AB7V43_11535, partial [Acidimicrobiia bacterium]
MPNLALRARTPGAVTTEIVELDGRQVVLAVVDGADRKGALSSVASDSWPTLLVPPEQASSPSSGSSLRAAPTSWRACRLCTDGAPPPR